MPFPGPTGLRLTAPNSSSPGHAPTIMPSAPGAEGTSRAVAPGSRHAQCTERDTVLEPGRQRLLLN